MNRLPWLAMALLASMLLATMALELGAGGPGEDETGIVPLRHAPLARARAPSEDPVDHTDAWVQTILGRPLFSRDRRPTPVVAKSGGETQLASLPRLTGVMVGPFGGRAIFAGDGGGKALVVAEGGTLGRFTVQAIAPGRVTIAGPDGVQNLQPSFDASIRRAMVEAQPQPVPLLPAQGTTQQVQQQLMQQQLRAAGQPFNPAALNVRPGGQFQRALPGMDNARPPQQGDDNQ